MTSHRIQRAAPATANPSSSSEAEVVTYPEQLHPKDELRVSEAVQEFRSRTEKKEGDCALALHLSVFSWNEGAKKIEYLSQCKTSSLVGLRNATDRVPSSTLQAVGQFFAALNPWITRRSITPHGDVASLRPSQFGKNAMENQTLLMVCLYGLAMAVPTPQIQKIESNQSYKSSLFALAAAHDLIVRCQTHWPLCFQKMIGDQLQKQQVSTQFRELLSRFYLCMSRNGLEKKKCKLVVEYLRKGVELRANDRMHHRNQLCSNSTSATPSE